ncbi:sensor domain-containing protein [Nocardioides sp. AE5]|uniref:sensor histidine kinase n=1 Tax=Nocardioides sp. AE5 TaxID=2962573 RepID=UPI002880F46E|nr:sensor domain-containing protein [Nocardioides sp. AE5]MDT0200559.1 sensor domain-containing protein [Nocardioides sp. AE5]
MTQTTTYDPSTQTIQMEAVMAPEPTGRAAPAWWRRTLLDSAYNITALVLALPAFVLVISGLALGAGLAITLLGFPVLALTVLTARGFAHVERARIRNMLHTEAPTPRYHRSAEDAGWLRRAFTPLTDPQGWLDVLWALVTFVTAIGLLVVTTVWWSLVAGGLSYWFWQRWLPESDANTGLAELIGLGEGRTTESLLMLAIGIFALLTLPLAMRLMALVHSSIGKVMLSSRAELQAEMSQLHDSRDAARAAEAGALRRLERDIHDGPQQRLVRLTMDLGRARKQVDTDPELARSTIEQALVQARETVDELRQLSRGIAPPILVDRGLRVALVELANRSTIEVVTRIEEIGKVDPHVETAAYFVASEALTNVAKHSGATRAVLTVERLGDRLVVEVGDDGVGGADIAKGHGLAGLDQRVRAADGSLVVDSPAGGPTMIRAEIACGS